MARISMKDIKPELTAEEITELEEAERMPLTFDEDCPEMTVSQLLEFRPFHHRNPPKQTVSLRLSASTLVLAKKYGRGYTAFLSRLLDEAIKDETLVRRCL